MIITADSVGSAQALVLSVFGRVVTTLPIVNGVVADVNLVCCCPFWPPCPG